MGREANNASKGQAIWSNKVKALTCIALQGTFNALQLNKRIMEYVERKSTVFILQIVKATLQSNIHPAFHGGWGKRTLGLVLLETEGLRLSPANMELQMNV